VTGIHDVFDDGFSKPPVVRSVPRFSYCFDLPSSGLFGLATFIRPRRRPVMGCVQWLITTITLGIIKMYVRTFFVISRTFVVRTEPNIIQQDSRTCHIYVYIIDSPPADTML
jgi:hypothetical protein